MSRRHIVLASDNEAKLRALNGAPGIFSARFAGDRANVHWYGEIAQAPRGAGGFGYDPLFCLTDLGVTSAELDPAHKNRISHRGPALHALAGKLADWR